VSDAPKLRLTIEFVNTGNPAALIWTLRQVIQAVKTSPVPMTIRIERVEED
jgi:hypothetical protein